jgi:addiction module RelB/DinJ family antitoxin
MAEKTTDKVAVNFLIDKELKNNMEQVCKDMGITMTGAITMFITKVVQEQRIPFEISAKVTYNDLKEHDTKSFERMMGYYKQMTELLKQSNE